MKTTTLKTLIDIFFLITIGALMLYLTTIAYATYKTFNVPSGIDSPSDFFGLRGVAYLISGLYTLIFILFTAAIYYVRKSILPLIKGEYFSDKVINSLKKSGSLLTISSVGMLAYYITKKLVFSQELWIGIDDSILGFLFLMIVGLFFNLLSTVFNNTRALKEENDLTI